MQYGIAFTPLVPTIVLWVALAAIVGFGLTVSSITGLLTVVIAVDAVLVVVLFVAHERGGGGAGGGGVNEPYLTA